MKLENYVAKSAKKILKVNKANGDEIGLFKDTNENTTFYCVAWLFKGEEIPKFRFFPKENEAFRYLNILMRLEK